MKKIIVLLILTSLLFEFEVLSQNNVEDSLLIELRNANEDTVRVNILFKLFVETDGVDADKRLKYINQALDIAKNCNYQIGVGRAYYNIGIYYYETGNYELAHKNTELALKIFINIENLKYLGYSYRAIGQLNVAEGNYNKAMANYKKSIATLEKLNDKSILLFTYISVGTLYYYKGDYKETLRYYQLSLSLAEEFKDNVNISLCLNNIGIVNTNFGNYSEALKYYQLGLKKFEELNDKLGAAECENNIGLVHYRLKNYNKALQYFENSTKMFTDLNYVNGLINSYNNIGSIYTEKGKYDEAIVQFNKSLQLSEQSGDKYNISISYSNLGDCYFNTKDLVKAKDLYRSSLEVSLKLNEIHIILVCYLNLAKIELKYNNPIEAIVLCNKSILFAKEIGVKNDLRDTYEILSDAYSMLNKDKQALEYYKLFKIMHDSIFNEENSENINEMETRYQTEKKQQQIELQETKLAQQESKIKQQKTLRNTLFGGLGAIFVISLLVGYAYILKRKANKKINAQKDEIGKQKGIIEKKNIHITDSINYAKRIQESVFLSGNEMKSHFRDSFLLNQPKDIVSGDFFWFTEVNNKKIFAVVDCTGHGVPGAFMSLIGNSLLNEIVKEKNILEPSEILNALHLGVIGVLRQGTEQSKANDGMDMVICVYDEKKKELYFSGARNFMYLKNGKDLEILDGDPFSIGEIPFRKDLDIKFNTRTVKIDGETKIYLMTDGYMDQFGGPKLKKFNQGPFEEMLLENLHLPMLEQKEKMLQAFTDWKGSYKQIDDVMILGISLS